MYTVARKLERPGGKIDVVGSTVDSEHLLNGHDGRLYPRGVHRLLARVLAPCNVHGDSYRRQEARVGHYDTMRSREYSGVFVPLNINTTCVVMHVVCWFVPLCCEDAMEKGPPTASCCKWHAGHGLVPQIAK